jgi:hypothetical protein
VSTAEPDCISIAHCDLGRSCADAAIDGVASQTTQRLTTQARMTLPNLGSQIATSKVPAHASSEGGARLSPVGQHTGPAGDAGVVVSETGIA